MSLWQKKDVNQLVDAVLLLDNVSEARSFLRDILTESELLEMANRLQAAKMLDEKVPYTEIVKQTGLSSTTVARISKWRSSVGTGGYQLILDKLKLKQS